MASYITCCICRICGGRPVILPTGAEIRRFVVKCDTLDCQRGPARLTPDDAKQAWNFMDDPACVDESPNMPRLQDAQVEHAPQTGPPTAMSVVVQDVVNDILSEYVKANSKHPAIPSMHAAAGIIFEELQEFWEEVRKQDDARDMEHAYHELVQTAAMCVRAAVDVVLPKPKQNQSQ